MTETIMDQRDIESILFNLENEKYDLVSELNKVCEQLNSKDTSENDIGDLKKEKEDLEYEIHEIAIDIAVYQEMMDKLFPSEIGACGFPCDGRCPQCGGSESYDPSSEVFAGGDY